VTAWRGATVLSCESSSVLAVVALAVRTGGGATRLLAANLTPKEQQVAIAPLKGDVVLRRLNESTVGAAAADPHGFRRHSESATAAGELALTMAPYEVVRIDPA